MIEKGRFILNDDNVKLSFFPDGTGGFLEIKLMGTTDDLNKVKQQLIKDSEKAISFDTLIPILRKMLTKKQIAEIGILIDPLARRILAYLAKDEE